MPYPNALDPDGPEQDYRAAHDPQTPDEKPGFLAGWGFSRDNGLGPLGPPIRGVAEGGLELAQGAAAGVGNIAGNISYLASLIPGDNDPEQYDPAKAVAGSANALEAKIHKQIAALRPDPATTGTAANTVSGLASFITQVGGVAAAAPAAAPSAVMAAVGSSMGYGAYKDARDDGIDHDTAAVLGLTTGAANALGGMLPGGLPAKWLTSLGTVPTYLAQMATGATGMTGFGMASRYSTHAILEANGYHELAEQAKVWDGQAMLADALNGVFIGGIHAHATEGQRQLLSVLSQLRKDPQAAPLLDAARQYSTARAAAVDRAPGIPANAATAELHAQMLDKATADVLSGRTVDVSPVLDRTDQQLTFLPDTRPGDVSETEARAIIADAFAKEGLPLAVPPVAAPKAAEPASGFAPAFEGRNAPPAEVGKPFLVARVASGPPDLASRNAGNPEAIADHLMRLEDYDRPQPVGAEQSDTLYVHEVTPREPFGQYQRGSQGQMLGTVLGRNRTIEQGISYSFPDGAQYDSRPVLQLPLTELRAEIKARTGTDSIDDLGVRDGAKAIEQVISDRLGAQRPAAAPLKIAYNAKLEGNDKDVEARFGAELAADPVAAEARYAQLKDSDGGRILNTDTARELSADYLKDRSANSRAVHEPASAFVKWMYARRLAEDPGAGRDNMVLLTAGGTGSGKTTGIRTTLARLWERSQIIYDTNSNGIDSVSDKIDQAHAAGKTVEFAFTDRDMIESLTNGALKRADRQEKEGGSGRTVPLSEHEATHRGARRTYPQVLERYLADDRVHFNIIDNSHGKENATLVATMPPIRYSNAREELIQALEGERKAGRISEAVYRGFRDYTDAEAEGTGRGVAGVHDTGPQAGKPEPRTGSRGEPEPQREGGGRRGTESAGLASVFTATGRRVDTREKLVELSDLLTSDKAGYPPELQPRQRTDRAASDMQVREIARDLHPEMLGESATADTGAPIVGPDNTVESGNGRVMALRQAYDAQTPSADAYRGWLEARGHDTKGMTQPVLVRERVTPMSAEDRRAFTAEANQSATAQMSAVERANVDARALNATVLSQLSAGSDINSPANRSFVRAFMSHVPVAEQGALMDARGELSAEGVRRVQAALLAKAYGGKPESNAILSRMLESTETDVRAVLGAMLDASPAFARLREMVDEGTVGKQYDISGALLKAVEETAKMRSTKQSLREYLAQGDLLGERYAAVDAFVKSFYNKAGTRAVGRESVSKTLSDYVDRAIAQRLDQQSLFNDAPVSAEKLMDAAMKERPEEGKPMTPGKDMFGLKQGAAKAEEVPIATDQQLVDHPNLETVNDLGGIERARAQQVAAEEAERMASEKAEAAIKAAVDCASRFGT